jgi:hypothetical protein
VDADALRQKAAELLERAKHERDPDKHLALLELAVACLVKARELDRGKKSN